MSARVRCTSGPMFYTSGYKYQLKKDITFSLPPEYEGISVKTDYIELSYREVKIKRGYAYNGASGPTVDTKNSMRPTAFHDAMYQLLAAGLIPRELKGLVDELFKELLRQDGMSKIRSSIWYQGVDKLSADASFANKDILLAP